MFVFVYLFVGGVGVGIWNFFFSRGDIALIKKVFLELERFVVSFSFIFINLRE